MTLDDLKDLRGQLDFAIESFERGDFRPLSEQEMRELGDSAIVGDFVIERRWSPALRSTPHSGGYWRSVKIPLDR